MVSIKKQTGSILINILAGIAIIAAMSAMAAPALRSYQPSLKLKAEGRRLISDLRYAQQLTLTEQKVYYLEMDAIGGSYSIIKEEAPLAPVKTAVLDNEINFQSITDLTDNKVVFNSYGAVSEAGTIILANTQGNTLTVKVKSSGYVQMQP